MSHRRPARQVFDPASVPRPRSSSSRIAPARCCCLSFILVCTVIFLYGLAFVAKTFVEVARNLASPHQDITAESTESHKVKPLVNSSSSFDVLATVWLDVTEHLAAGLLLPPETAVVTYEAPPGNRRSEAILFSGPIIENVTMSERAHGNAKVKIPIEPLYSQNLGPSTLRATFKIRPYGIESLGRLNSSLVIYPPGLPIGPRSPTSPLLHETRLINGTWTPRTISEALEHSSVNANLLTLLPSKWRLEDVTPNKREAGVKVLKDAHFDKSEANVAFTENKKVNGSSRHLYVDEEQRLMIPHLLARSRLVLVKEERSLQAAEYMKRRKEAADQLSATCKPSSRVDSHETVAEHSGLCSRPYHSSLFENFISTMTEEEGHLNLFYAPFLIQQQRALASRHYRTLPLSRPLPGSASKVTTTVERKECLIPLVEIDDSGDFVLFDWHVSFSSHNHMRASLPDDIHWIRQLSPGINVTMAGLPESPRVNASVEDDIQWQVRAYRFGDREHQNSRPTLVLLSAVLETLVSILARALTSFYWYTRATTCGLSSRGQWMLLCSFCLQLYLQAPTPWDLSLAGLVTTFLFLVFSIRLPLQLWVLLRLEYDKSRKLLRIQRRPAGTRERATNRLDGQFGWIIPVSLLLFLTSTMILVKPHTLAVKSAQGCSPTVKKDRRVFASHLSFILYVSGDILQMWHNHRSGLFAGNFKLTEVIGLASLVLAMSVHHVEFIGGWQPRRDAVSLTQVGSYLLASLSLYQALTYPGVRQDVDDEDRDL